MNYLTTFKCRLLNKRNKEEVDKFELFSIIICVKCKIGAFFHTLGFTLHYYVKNNANRQPSKV